MQIHSHYAEGIPAEIRPVIEDIAEASKDAPWYAAYTHMNRLAQLAMQAFPDDYSASSQLHGCLVAAVLELMGADPRRVNDPFQAAVYHHSARKDFRKAANKYLRKIGGQDVAEAKMREWAESNPVLTKELGAGAAMPGWDVGKVAPHSRDEAVVALMKKAEEAARLNMKEQGEMPPFFFAESRDGQQTVFDLNTDQGRARDQIPKLRVAVRVIRRRRQWLFHRTVLRGADQR